MLRGGGGVRKVVKSCVKSGVSGVKSGVSGENERDLKQTKSN